MKLTQELLAISQTPTNEAVDHMGNPEYATWSGWRAACKKVDPNFWIEGDKDIAQAMVGPKPYKQGETRAIGEWDGEKGIVFKDVNEAVVNKDEYDKYENGELGQEEAVAVMFTRLARQGKDPLDMISHRFGWSSHELDDLAQQHGFKDSADWLKKLQMHQMQNARNAAEAGRGPSARDFQDVNESQEKTADKLDIGDVVEIVGNVEHQGSVGEIESFGKDKKFVVVKLYQGGSYSYHSSDVISAEDEHDHEDDENSDEEEFYVAFHDVDEGKSWIGKVEKTNRWDEHPYKGEADYRWGGHYMSYLTPDDIMQHIKNDYSRHLEIKGPFSTGEKAEEYVESKWGNLDESAKLDEARKHRQVPYQVKIETNSGSDWKDRMLDAETLEDIEASVSAPSNDTESHARFDISQLTEIVTEFIGEGPDGKGSSWDGMDFDVKSLSDDVLKISFTFSGVTKKKMIGKYMDEVIKSGVITIMPAAEEKMEESWSVTIESKGVLHECIFIAESKAHAKAQAKSFARKRKMDDVTLHEPKKHVSKKKGWVKTETCSKSEDRKGHRVNTTNGPAKVHSEHKVGKQHIIKVQFSDNVMDEFPAHEVEFIDPVAGGEIKESITYTDFDDWKSAVLNSYPAQAKKMKFKGRFEGGKHTISAEVPGEDRSYGVWDGDTDKGVVLSESN